MKKTSTLSKLPSLTLAHEADIIIDLEKRQLVKFRYGLPEVYRIDVINGVVIARKK